MDPFKNHSENTVFLDDEKKYPYKLMRSLFLISNLSPEMFVLDKGLPETAVDIIRGDNWQELRDSLKEKNPDNIKTLAAIVTDASAGLELEIYAHRMAQVQDQMNFVKNHRQKWGDYFARNSDETLMTNHLGQPLPLEIPSSIQDLAGRKAHYELIMSYMKVLDTIDNLQNRLTGKAHISLEGKTEPNVGYAHLLESKKDD